MSSYLVSSDSAITWTSAPVKTIWQSMNMEWLSFAHCIRWKTWARLIGNRSILHQNTTTGISASGWTGALENAWQFSEEKSRRGKLEWQSASSMDRNCLNCSPFGSIITRLFAAVVFTMTDLETSQRYQKLYACRCVAEIKIDNQCCPSVMLLILIQWVNIHRFLLSEIRLAAPKDCNAENYNSQAKLHFIYKKMIQCHVQIQVIQKRHCGCFKWLK